MPTLGKTKVSPSLISTGSFTGSFLGTASYATTASYAMNGGGGGSVSLQTGSIVNQTILYNVTTSQDNTITGLSLTGNKWGVSVVEEWNSSSIVGDNYYNSCSLLLHFSGSNTSTTFLDNSPNSFTITAYNGAAISTAQSKFGGSSGYFDGTDDSITVPDNSVFDFGSGDFTIEYWEYRTSSTDNRTVMSRKHVTYTPYMVGYAYGGTLAFYASSNGSSWTIGSLNMGSIVLNTWTHYAVTRQGNTFRTFQNGTLIASTTSTDTFPVGSAAVEIGQWAGYYFQGYLDELRITKGIARYTGSFVTQSTEFSNYASVNQYETKYIGLVGGLNDSTVDYGVEKLSETSLKIRKMSASGQPLSGSGALSASVDRVYVNILNYDNISVSASVYNATSASYALSASYAPGGGGTTLTTGSTYPITSSWSNNSTTSSYSLISNTSTSASYSTTSSFATVASTANSATTATSATSATTSTSASYSTTSSYVSNSLTSTSASYALTASYALNASGGGGGSGTVTGSVNYIAKFVSGSTVGNSVIYETGSNIGIGTTTPNSKLNINSSGSLVSGSVVFSVEGTQGSLFSVDDSLSGSLMSVNDISGLPILEVFSDDRLVAGTFNANTFVVTGSRVGIGTSTPMAKLQVSGSISGSSFTSSVSNGIGFLGTSSFSVTSSYSLNALTASYALNASGGGGGGSGTVTGSTNYIAKFTSTTAVGNSSIYETGSYLGIGTSNPNSKLNINSSGSLTSGSVVFSVEGTQGSLFSVDDSLSGSLMSVNDISGLPILEVFSDDRLVVGTYNSNALVVTGSKVGIGTNNPVAKLQVNGNISGSSFTGSVFGTSSWSSNTLSSSYALSASYAPGGGGTTLTTGSTYPITSSWSNNAITASYAMNGGSGGSITLQTGSIVNQTILYNVTTSQDNTITGLNLSSNKWSVTVVEEWNSASIAGGDTYYNSCSLLMHFSGSNGSTTFTDNSPSPKSFTVNGNSQISTAQSKFGSSSVYFDGTGDYLSSNTSNDFAFGTGDFTVECWMYSSDVSSATQRGIFQTSDTSGGLKTTYTTGVVLFQGYDGVGNLTGALCAIVGGTFLASSVPVVSTNTWYHIALVRYSGTSTLYVNGTSVASATTTGNCSGTYLALGGYYNTSYLYYGYLDELRITKGIARYTGSFTSPTSEFVNYNTVNQYVTKYVGLVGGLNDSTVDYGVEKLTDSSLKIRKMTATGQPLSGSGTLSASVDRVYVNVIDYTNVMITSSYALTASYVLGGIQTGSIANQTILYNVTTSQENTISGLDLSGNKWNVSVIEEWNSASIAGDDYYSSCSLLLHFSGSNGSTSIIDSSPNNFTVTSYNGAAISTAQSKFGGTSLYLDGTNDYVSIANNAQFNFSSGTFTIELWIYFSSVSGTPMIISNYQNSTNGWFIELYSGKIIAGFSGDGIDIQGTTTILTNTWYHLALSGTAGSYKMFLNGVQEGSTYTGGTTLSSTSPVIIGQILSSYYFNGYFDDVRITNGIARYTSDFSVPTSAFPDNTGSSQLQTKYIGLVGGLNDTNVDYGVEKLSDSSLKIRKMTVSGTPVSGTSTLSASVDRVYVNVLNYKDVQTTAQSASYALTSSYVANAPSGESFHPFLLG